MLIWTGNPYRFNCDKV